MQKTRLVLSLATMLLSSISAARAAEQAVEPQIEQLAALLQQEGYQAKVETPGKDAGRRFIRSSTGGMAFNLFVMNCEEQSERNCDSVQFFGWYTKGGRPLTHAAMNGFNEKFRYAKAYVDKDGDAVIEMDLNMDKGGMAKDQFLDNLSIWVSLYADFAEVMAAETDGVG